MGCKIEKFLLSKQTSSGLKINQSIHHITIPNFNFLDSTSDSFGIHINTNIINFICSSGYLFQRIQVVIQYQSLSFRRIYRQDLEYISITLQKSLGSLSMEFHFYQIWSLEVKKINKFKKRWYCFNQLYTI